MINAFFEAPSLSWRDRLIRRLFPSRRAPLRQLTDDMQDVIFVKTDLYVSWVDRVRLLVSGYVRVDVYIYTERKPGKTRADTNFYVKPGKGE